MPVRAAGCRIEPPVSVPSAPNAASAATAAAEPPLEPPGTRDKSHGLRVSFIAEFSVDEPMAKSSRLVLPNGIAATARNFRITVGSYVVTQAVFLRRRVAQSLLRCQPITRRVLAEDVKNWEGVCIRLHIAYVCLAKFFDVLQHMIQLLLKSFRLGFSQIYACQPGNV